MKNINLISSGEDAKEKVIDEINRSPEKRKSLSNIPTDDLIIIIKISEVYEFEKGFLLLTKLYGYTSIGIVSKEFMFTNYVINNLKYVLDLVHSDDNKYYIDFTNDKLHKLFDLKYRDRMSKFFKIKRLGIKEFTLIKRS